MILQHSEGDSLSFWCPGCNKSHRISHGNGGWTWNGNVNKPTFAPSVLVRTGHYIPEHTSEDCWCTSKEPHAFECTLCHSFVVEGRIKFLDDCTHTLAGQTVDLPEWPCRE